MDLKTYKFPEVGKADFAFPTYDTIPELLEEAKKRGFYRGNTEYNNLFAKLFFEGGGISFKKDLPEDFKTSAYSYMRALMGSFAPKHEHKEAICAMLLSELAEDTGGK